MARSLAPAAQVSSLRATSQATGTRMLTVTDDFKLMANDVQRSAIEDAHTSAPKLMLKHRFKTFSLSGLTDQDLSWLQNFEDGAVTVSFLNGRNLSFRGVSQITEGGITETLTTGKIDEVTFVYTSHDDRG